MPRYFFDICDGDGLHRDDVGDEFEDIEEARELAQALLPDIARGRFPDGDAQIITCDVRDEAGLVVYRGEISFRGTRRPCGAVSAPR